MFTIVFKFSGVFASVLDACFKCFICILLLQILHLNVSKVNRSVAHGMQWKA
jgi:hypothetical protein